MDKDNIKKTIEEVLYSLCVSFDEVDIIEQNGTTVFMVKTKDDAQILIGVKGANLSALNHVVKRMLENSTAYDCKNRIHFLIDVNDYIAQRNKETKDRAKTLAERVKSFKTESEMEPMSSYERMLVHSILADDREIETESRGFGKERRVVIMYKKDA